MQAQGFSTRSQEMRQHQALYFLNRGLDKTLHHLGPVGPASMAITTCCKCIVAILASTFTIATM